jgi:copper transport protein
MRHFFKRGLGIAIVFIALAILGVRRADAHGYILRSIPGDQTVLNRAPTRVQVWFSESLEAAFSTITVTDARGEPIALTEAGVSPGNSGLLAAKLPLNLPDGAYLVTLRVAFASDGHVDTQTIVFWVGQQVGTVSDLTGARLANGWEVSWRALTFFGLTLLFGTLFLYSAVLLPGWGSPRFKAGNLVPRVMRRLAWIVGAGLLLSLVGSVFALLQQTTSLFATDLNRVLSDGLWAVVLKGTELGNVLEFRFIMLLAIGALFITAIYYANRQPFIVLPFWGVNLILGAVAVGTLTLASHAAGATLWTPLALGVDFIHVLLNGVWIGGLIALTLILPVAIEPLRGEDRQRAILAVLRRFSVIGTIAVLMMIVTGLFSASEFVWQASDLTTTSYGAALIFKVILVLPLLILGLYHHSVAGTGALAEGLRSHGFRGNIDRILTTLRIETLIGIVLLGIVSVLTATPPPIPPNARANAAPPTQTIPVNGLEAALSVDPNTTGSNSYSVSLTRDNVPVTDAKVVLRFADPALDRRTPPLMLDNGGDGTYNSAGGELDRTANYAALVDVQTSGSETWTRFAFHWTLRESAGTTRNPTLVNFLALVAILMAAGMLIRPSVARLLTAMSVHTESLVAAIAVCAITAILFAMGIVLMNQASQQYDSLQNSPPATVNPVFPDQAAVAAGRMLYTDRCAVCHSPNGALNPQQGTSVDLRDSSPTHRDEDLYRLIAHGDYHARLNDLTDTDRWNVIAYLRSAAFVRATQ